MTEARGQTPVQGTRYEIASTVPRDENGQRIGTGAMLDRIGPGLFGDKVNRAVMRGLVRAGKLIEVPPGGVEQTENLPDARYDKDQRYSSEMTQLVQEDEQRTTGALETTRSALQREIAVQENAARPKPNEQREGVPFKTRARAYESELEPVTFYSTQDGHELFTLPLPKGGKYTTGDVNQALREAGYDLTYSPAWTPGGWRMRGRDIWLILKMLLQAVAPPELMQT